MIVQTTRLRLRAFEEADQASLAAMHADPEVMHDYGGPISPERSLAALRRYMTAVREIGFGRWALEDHAGRFLGYTGVMPSWPDHPLGPHYEIGWRLVRSAWGHGYATEAARAALADFFQRSSADEVLAYTARDNLRSQAVMARLGLQRDASRDFTNRLDDREWSGLVWVAQRPRA